MFSVLANLITFATHCNGKVTKFRNLLSLEFTASFQTHLAYLNFSNVNVLLAGRKFLVSRLATLVRAWLAKKLTLDYLT